MCKYKEQQKTTSQAKNKTQLQREERNEAEGYGCACASIMRTELNTWTQKSQGKQASR